MKTILITGINGFLGSNLAKSLSEDYNIIGIEVTTINLHRLNGFSFKIYQADSDLDMIFTENKVFAIIHAATIYRRNDESFNVLISTNLLLPIKLYEFANKYKISIFLNTDSFFNNPKYNYKYLLEYTLSKQHALEWLKLIQGSCKLINMKIFHMYGPYDSPNKFIPKIISDLKENQSVINLSMGEQTRDFIYIEDVVAAYKIVLNKYIILKDDYIEFQIATGTNTSIKEIVILIKELTKSKSELGFGKLDYRENEIMKAEANIMDIVTLGWKPIYSLKEGLTKTIIS